jgi:V/A-type H+/Na+-transporting ATPase subunit E
MDLKKKLESGQDKVSQIVNILRSEALEPAKADAENIVVEAQAKGEQIIKEAEKRAQQMIEEARRTIEQQRTVFQSSLAQGAKQAVEALKQAIENKLFKEELLTAVDKESADPKVIAQFINAICTAVERESLSTDIEAFIPKQVSSEAVSKFLLADVHKRLKDKGLSLGDFAGGAQVKFIDKRMTVDLSDEALKELLSNYVRKDFRQLIFGK